MDDTSNRHAVILAGGRGTRLRPYTVTLPKPLVPVGDMPILEIILTQLVAAGFRSATIAVNHQAELIRAFFGDGAKWGIKLSYSLERQPLGTMGPLKIMRELPEHFLVMNGDVLTDLKFDSFFSAHLASNAIYTISGYARIQPIDFGVLHLGTEGSLTGFEEKPRIAYNVSMGIYAVSRAVLPWIPDDAAFGFDQLMHVLLDAQRDVKVRIHDGFWMDIGRPDDYQAVCEQWPELSKRLLPAVHGN